MRSSESRSGQWADGPSSWASWPMHRRRKWAAVGDPPEEADRCSAAAAAAGGADGNEPVSCSAIAQLLDFW